MTRTISDWLPASERARAFFGLVAIPLSAVVGAPITSYLVVDLGWRAMFAIISGLGIVWAIFWLWLFRDSPQDSRHTNAAERKMIADSRAEMAKSQKKSIDWHFIFTHPTLFRITSPILPLGTCSFLPPLASRILPYHNITSILKALAGT